MRQFIAALRFLTVFPIPWNMGTDPADLSQSVKFFPWVGLLLGCLAAILGNLLSHVFPVWPTSALLVIAMASVSGGLHLDGLSDAADGLMSSRPRERILEIMRDSHVGVMGVLVIVGDLLIRFACLASLSHEALWKVLLLAPVAGRSSLIIGMAVLPYVRTEGGLGTLFYQTRSWKTGLLAVFFLLLLSGIVAGGIGIWAGLTAILGVLALSFHCYRKIGGATGDTLGASCEIAEVLQILVMTGCLAGSRT